MRRPLILLVGLALAGLTLLPSATSATSATSAAPAKATLNALPTASEVGKKVKLKGKAGDSVGTVKIQRRYGAGAWATVAKVKTNAKGKFSKRVPLEQPGATSFRVTRGKDKSAARALSVFGWLDLTQQPHFAAENAGYESTPLSIGGRVFPTTFHAFGGSFRSFDISGCTKVEGWTGFVDGSGATMGDVQELQWNSGTYAESIPEPPVLTTPPGAPVLRTIPVAGDNILYMELDVVQAAGQEQTAMGSPRAYCNVAGLKTPPLPFLRPSARWSVG